MHARNLLVSQDVIPFNNDYNFKALSKYNDYLILMAYDQHHAQTKPGPNSSQKWIEAAVDNMVAQVPASKVILAMAAFGHDWKMNAKKVMTTADVTYQQAMASASNSEAKIDFDNDSYNLHFQYYDSENKIHQVYFVDAATNFNTVRYATELNLAGTALWRLGGEDLRLWDFYDKPMTKTALQKFDFVQFNKIKSVIAPVFEGEGEILDIVASPKDGTIRSEVDKESMLISEEFYDALPSTYVIRRFGATNKRKIVLSYDDGPDPKYTKQILDTLAYYHVPASFFLVGYQIENNIPIVKRIFREGHEIGNHTFTHPDMSLVGSQRASIEMDATRLLIECITGHSTILFRAPFNADSEPGKYEELAPLALSRKKNYITVGESIDPNDWRHELQESTQADTIFKRVVEIYQKKIHNLDPSDTTISGSIILLHDAGGDRTNTVKATGMIIRYFQSKGYEFTTVADLLGKKPDDVMPPVAQDKQYYWLQFNYVLAELGYLGGNFFFAVFLVFLLLSSLRLIFMGITAGLEKKKRSLLLQNKSIFPTPLVSVIVPAYNEEVNAVSSIHNLLKCDYPEFEIIFIDDGSTDTTYEIVKKAFANDARVKVFTKQNGGKASALNNGVGHANGDFLVCIDADTKLAYNAISMLMRNFYIADHASNEKVGAIAGAVKVGNEVNLLTKWQSIEYITSQNFDRKGFAYLNAITVVPGAIGAFRKDAIIEAGGFTTDTLAEDCDITVRILKAGYTVINEPAAHAFTEVPEKMSQFMKQRVRWSFGVLQTFWKHKETLFNTHYKSLGLVAMPDMLLFRYIIPFFMPLADVLMIIGLITGNVEKIGLYFLLFVVVDAIISGISFAFEKEHPSKLIWLIPQRLVYRWIMMVVFFKAIRRAIKGELQVWGVLKRTGNVKEL
jgi:cellulose synthase/poly-beta-1,6-N-acetylglucosamine synthase-like glycosyltransferase/peptidoglycan/xylan/chitin deacetylase (PgdA/CDA1 family)